MNNRDRMKALITKINARSDDFRMPSKDMDKVSRLRYAVYGDFYLDDRDTQVEKYKVKQKLRKAHIDKFDKIQKAKRLKMREDKLTFKAVELNDLHLKNNKPVLWCAQFITCDVKRTNITRRINESLTKGQITGNKLVSMYKAVGLALNDRRQLSKRLVDCDLISRNVSTRSVETLVKTEILKVNTRIAGTKLPQLTLIATSLDMDFDKFMVIYRKLSTQEIIDRRNKRAEAMID